MVGYNVSAQNDVPHLASDLFSKQIQIFPQEKIYVQTDKPYYVSGENIWFCAHVVDAVEHLPVTASRYVYIELIDPLDSVFVRHKILHDSISYSGHIMIPDEAPEGIYELRAYTRFMENVGEEYFFSKQVSIYHPQSRNYRLNSQFEYGSKDKVSAVFNFKQSNNNETVMPEKVKVTYKGISFNLNLKDDGSSDITVKCATGERGRFLLVESVLNKFEYSKYVYIPADINERFDLSFYPEGGYLLEGVPVQVAFKAIRSDGASISVTGRVYDDLGDEITAFNTQHNGMGRFTLLSEAERSYYVMASINDGEHERFELPAVLSSGYGLSAKWVKEKLYVSVQNAEGHTIEDELYLIAHTRGTVYYGDNWDKNRDYLFLEKNNFPSGVLHLMLLDSKMNPLSERLVFVNNDDQAKVDYNTNKDVYSSRSLVENTVRLTDNEGNPLQGSFSVSVTDDKEVRPDSSSILTNLLLTSDLRGRIENPSHYFSKDTTLENKLSYLLDLLMMTQGWRRYNVSGLLRGEFTHTSSFLEAGSVISGVVKRVISGKPDSGVEVSALSTTDDYVEMTVTDKEGRFYLQQCELPDSSSITVSISSKKAKKLSELLLDPETFPSRTTLPPIENEAFDQDLMTSYVEKSEQRYSNENGMRDIYLDEVIVTAKRKNKPGFYLGPDLTITEEQIDNATDGMLINKLKTFGLKIRRSEYGDEIIYFPHVSSSDNSVPQEPLIFVDDNLVDTYFIKTLYFHDVAQIDILKRRKSVTGDADANGVISIHLRKDVHPRYSLLSHIKKAEPFLGYQKRVEFYSPRYDTPETLKNFIPDLRTTIHWQPNVQADSNGIASFNFYTADSETSYSVVIEGITSDGKIIHKKGKIEKVTSNNMAYELNQ